MDAPHASRAAAHSHATNGKPANGHVNGNAAKPSLVNALKGWVSSAFAPKADASIKESIEEAIEEALEERSQETALAPEEQTMLRNVLTFGDLSVHDIMTPRTEILAVPYDVTLEALKAHIIDKLHTRIPVYRDTLDQVEGFLHLKDLVPMLSGDQPYDLRRVMRQMLFVPPSMRIIDLLVKMRRMGSHMAVVVDEYGGTDGLVTLEDVFEEIVGDIHDEHDEDEGLRELSRVGDNAFEADARVRVEKVEQELGFSLLTEQQEEEFDTLGGLIFFELGRVPAKGEIIPHASGLRFEILEADPRRIKRVRIIQSPDLAPQA